MLLLCILSSNSGACHIPQYCLMRMCISTVLISCNVPVDYSTFYADFDLELPLIAIVKQNLRIWMVPNVYCFTQPCKLYKYALAPPIPLATSVEATGVEGGASDVPFATLDHRVMIHPPRSLRLHTLHYHTLPLCPRLCVCVCGCVRCTHWHCWVFQICLFLLIMAQCVVVCKYTCVCVCV